MTSTPSNVPAVLAATTTNARTRTRDDLLVDAVNGAGPKGGATAVERSFAERWAQLVSAAIVFTFGQDLSSKSLDDYKVAFPFAVHHDGLIQDFVNAPMTTMSVGPYERFLDVQKAFVARFPKTLRSQAWLDRFHDVPPEVTFVFSRLPAEGAGWTRDDAIAWSGMLALATDRAYPTGRDGVAGMCGRRSDPPPETFVDRLLCQGLEPVFEALLLQLPPVGCVWHRRYKLAWLSLATAAAALNAEEARAPVSGGLPVHAPRAPPAVMKAEQARVAVYRSAVMIKITRKGKVKIYF